MSVPRRRVPVGRGLSLTALPSLALKLFDAQFVFDHTKTLLLWGFAPAVLLIGLRTEPRPSLLDIFNIWE